MNASIRNEKIIATCLAAGVVIATLGFGCSNDKDRGPATVTGQNGAKAPAPIAKPGAPIGQNNPPPGQPNHMSPQMEAQLKHYQSMGK